MAPPGVSTMKNNLSLDWVIVDIIDGWDRGGENSDIFSIKLNIVDSDTYMVMGLDDDFEMIYYWRIVGTRT